VVAASGEEGVEERLDRRIRAIQHRAAETEQPGRNLIRLTATPDPRHDPARRRAAATGASNGSRARWRPCAIGSTMRTSNV
jgi:hypothetical protein